MVVLQRERYLQAGDAVALQPLRVRPQGLQLGVVSPDLVMEGSADRHECLSLTAIGL